MATIIGGPERYIQGYGVLGELCKHLQHMGKSPFILVSASGKARVEEKIAQSAQEFGTKLTYEIFRGECSRKEIDRVLAAYQSSGCDVVVGVGGGKAQDTAKAAAYYASAPVVVVPTAASSDAPCTTGSLVYSEDGVFETHLYFPRNPNVVLVDTEIICKAPSRLLVAGMGDALATYFEARACQRSDSNHALGGKSTRAALALSRACYDTLLSDGARALAAVSAGVCTKSVENIVEANTYLSGVGAENCGTAAAHAIHNGFTQIPQTHRYYHGEKVAFGTIAQLVLENAPEDELNEVLDFCQAVGLPMTLAELGIEEIRMDDLMKVAETACGLASMRRMPFAVTPRMACDAIIAADALGKAYKARHT
ncbi:MAG: glycerol dehydrogenase [Christensenellales bacterium]|jgi:glycerol dehydrogenase